MMANRSRRRLLNLFMRETQYEVDYLLRRRRANSIRAWDNHKLPTRRPDISEQPGCRNHSRRALRRGWVHISHNEQDCIRSAQSVGGAYCWTIRTELTMKLSISDTIC